MIKQLKSIAPFVLLLCVTVSCSAQDHSSADQLIKGPIEITTEWQTIPFEKPLRAAPYIQYLQFLSCNNQYNFIEVGPPDKEQYILMSDRFKRIADKQIIELEVIASDGKNDYRLFYSTNGYDYGGPAQGCKYVGYSLRGNELMKLTLPEGTQFISIKVRANVKMAIDHLYWVAPDYERSPNKKWSDLHSSRVIDMKSQALPSNN